MTTAITQPIYPYVVLISLHRGRTVGHQFNTVKGMMGSLLNSVHAKFISLPWVAALDTQGLWMKGAQQAVLYQIKLQGDSAEVDGIIHAVRKLARDNGAFAGCIKVPTMGAI